MVMVERPLMFYHEEGVVDSVNVADKELLMAQYKIERLAAEEKNREKQRAKWREAHARKDKKKIKIYYRDRYQRRKKYYKDYYKVIRPIRVMKRWFSGIEIKLSLEEMEQILGISKIDFVKHIENKWRDGMTWDNCGMWHVDHIKSKASFSNLKDMEFVNECYHYSNAQPIWAHENMKKDRW